MCGIWFALDYKSIDTIYGFLKLKHRGPDSTVYHCKDNIMYGFHRLAINDLSPNGDQPIIKNGIALLCNGEIYNYKKLKSTFYQYDFQGGSDCEVIINMYKRYGEDFVKKLDGEFAFILHDIESGVVLAARDHVGVRPLFYGKINGSYVFSSEAKGIVNIVDEVEELLPGVVMKVVDNEATFKNYSVELIKKQVEATSDELRIRSSIIDAVSKRLIGDRPIGFLLSGGLDSSIICSVASRILNTKLKTFSIGTSSESPDIKAAREVANSIGSEHTEVYYTIEDGLAVIEDVIYHTESYDCTTIRASVPMYILSRYISENTDIKVILSGEGADEVFGGYIYLRNAPDSNEFKKECGDLIKNLYTFDIKRADRTTAAHGLELRVPFLDAYVINEVDNVDNEVLYNKGGVEKKILRDAFKSYLPISIYNRQKDAFSDAVGYEWVNHCKTLGGDTKQRREYDHNMPLTSEESYYRGIFCKQFGERSSNLIPKIWRPKWCGEVFDPSAKQLNIHYSNNDS